MKQSDKIIQGEVQWQCPSNIALVKYWGKYGVQLPMNPSLSLTLKHATTSTGIVYEKSDVFSIKYFFDGQENLAFSKRVITFLESIFDLIPWVKNLSLVVSSSNSFPHSAGIASSASAFGALALCLCSIEKNLGLGLAEDEQFYEKASELARLGSGSAGRSVYPFASTWGKIKALKHSSNHYAQIFQLSGFFQGLRDAVLLVSQKEKSVSSSAGHSLMKDHPFRNARIDQANKNIDELIEAMKTEDLESFSKIIENEAMTLHGLMMSSNPSFVLLSPASLAIIEAVKQYRDLHNIFLTFTIDAGPNIHLLYHESNKSQIHAFINDKLKPHLDDQKWLDDCIGEGPVRIK